MESDVNGTHLPKPLLNVNVGSEGERGMLGIAIDTKNENGNKSFPSSLSTSNTTRVFLYFTATAVEQLTSNLTQARDAVATGNSTLATGQLIGIRDEISDILKTITSDSDGAKTNTPLSSRLYRYELENNTLANPKLLLELPSRAKLCIMVVLFRSDRIIMSTRSSVTCLAKKNIQEPRPKIIKMAQTLMAEAVSSE